MGKIKEVYHAMQNGDIEEAARLLDKEKYGQSLDEQISELAAEYHAMITSDHHKDHDCHWSITREWSYGEDDKWNVLHNGYLYNKVDSFYETYEEAQEALIEELSQAIEQQKLYQHNRQNGEAYEYDI
jgi:hypothetical protein